MEVCKLSLELDVIVGGAGDIARATGASAHFFDRLVHGGAHGSALTHAEIVVRAPHSHVACAAFSKMVCGRVGTAAALQVGENAIAALLTQRLEMLAEAILVNHFCLRLALTDVAQPS